MGKPHGRTIQDYFGLERKTLLMAQFWDITETLPQVSIGGRTFDLILFLRKRFKSDGTLRAAYKEVARYLGVNVGQVPKQCAKALRMMQHPSRSRYFLLEKECSTP